MDCIIDHLQPEASAITHTIVTVESNANGSQRCPNYYYYYYYHYLLFYFVQHQLTYHNYLLHIVYLIHSSKVFEADTLRHIDTRCNC